MNLVKWKDGRICDLEKRGGEKGLSKTDHKITGKLAPDQMEAVSEGVSALGIYKPGFQYKKESLLFFKNCVGDEVYESAMNSEAGHVHHDVVARMFLKQTDWEKFVWIEEHGSLDGFPG